MTRSMTALDSRCRRSRACSADSPGLARGGGSGARRCRSGRAPTRCIRGLGATPAAAWRPLGCGEGQGRAGRQTPSAARSIATCVCLLLPLLLLGGLGRLPSAPGVQVRRRAKKRLLLPGAAHGEVGCFRDVGQAGGGVWGRSGATRMRGGRLLRSPLPAECAARLVHDARRPLSQVAAQLCPTSPLHHPLRHRCGRSQHERDARCRPPPCRLRDRPGRFV